MLFRIRSKQYMSNPDVMRLYASTMEEFRTKIRDLESKALKAMRITLMLKVLITLSSIYSISAWLEDHHRANTWALILVISEVAGVLLDTLPYFQQRIEIPKMKVKLEHIYFELVENFSDFERGKLSEDEALRRYFANRKAWIKTVS